MTLVSSSRQQVTVLTNRGLITVVHAYGVCSLRRSLWLHMKANKGCHPWVTLRDFNCVMQYADKKGGELPSANAMEEFQQALEDCELMETQYVGSHFTWCNNRKGRNKII